MRGGVALDVPYNHDGVRKAGARTVSSSPPPTPKPFDYQVLGEVLKVF